MVILSLSLTAARPCVWFMDATIFTLFIQFLVTFHANNEVIKARLIQKCDTIPMPSPLFYPDSVTTFLIKISPEVVDGLSIYRYSKRSLK